MLSLLFACTFGAQQTPQTDLPDELTYLRKSTLKLGSIGRTNEEIAADAERKLKTLGEKIQPNAGVGAVGYNQLFNPAVVNEQLLNYGGLALTRRADSPVFDPLTRLPFAFNSNQNALEDKGNAARTVLAFSRAADAIHPRLVLFVDGHVDRLSLAEWSVLSRASGIPDAEAKSSVPAIPERIDLDNSTDAQIAERFDQIRARRVQNLAEAIKNLPAAFSAIVAKPEGMTEYLQAIQPYQTLDPFILNPIGVPPGETQDSRVLLYEVGPDTEPHWVIFRSARAVEFSSKEWQTFRKQHQLAGYVAPQKPPPSFTAPSSIGGMSKSMLDEMFGHEGAETTAQPPILPDPTEKQWTSLTRYAVEQAKAGHVDEAIKALAAQTKAIHNSGHEDATAEGPILMEAMLMGQVYGHFDLFVQSYRQIQSLPKPARARDAADYEGLQRAVHLLAAACYLDRGNVAEAEHSIDRMNAMPKSDDPLAHSLEIPVHAFHGTLIGLSGDFTTAERELDLTRRMILAEPQSPELLFLYGHVADEQSALLNTLGQTDKAQSIERNAIDYQRTILAQARQAALKDLPNVGPVMLRSAIEDLVVRDGGTYRSVQKALGDMTSSTSASGFVEGGRRARDLFQRAQITRVDPIGAATLDMTIAIDSLYRGQVADARESVGDIDSLIAEGGLVSSAWQAQRLMLLGLISSAESREPEAEESFRESLHRGAESSATSNNAMAFVRVRTLLARSLVIERHWDEARTQLSQAETTTRVLMERSALTMSEPEITDLASSSHDADAMAWTLATRSGSPSQDMTAAAQDLLDRKAIVLEILRQSKAVSDKASGDPAIANLRRTLSELRSRIATTDAQRVSPTELAGLEQEEAAAERGLISALSAGRGEWRLPTASTESVRARLSKDTFVDFVRYQPFRLTPFKGQTLRMPAVYAAAVYQAGEPPVVVELGPAATIDLEVERFRDRFFGRAGPRSISVNPGRKQPGTFAEFRLQAKKLFDLVLKPLHLGAAKTIYVSPDGTLSRIPFEALSPDGSHFVVEGSKVVYLSSGRDLVEPSTGKAGKGAAIFAAPDFDLGVGESRGGIRFKALPFSQEEGKAVRDILGRSGGSVRLWTGADASAANLEKLHSPKILHFATHGFVFPPALERLSVPVPGFALSGQVRFSSSPLLRTGIALAGVNHAVESGWSGEGWVSAYRLMSLDLSGTDLVTLSACDTGLGDVRDGEGVIGLRRAFRFAGAKNVVMSLFPVPDKGAADLMKVFYEGISKGASPSGALRTAQLAELKKSPDSLLWAFFVIEGTGK